MKLEVSFVFFVAASAGVVATSSPSWAQSSSCTACEQQSCSSELAACNTPACQSIHACFSSSRCISGGSAEICYCGTTSPSTCLTVVGSANGPCAGVIAGQIPPAQIPLILTNPGQFPTSPLTEAIQLGICSAENC